MHQFVNKQRPPTLLRKLGTAVFSYVTSLPNGSGNLNIAVTGVDLSLLGNVLAIFFGFKYLEAIMLILI